MQCPQCNQRVPAKLLWVVSGANGSSCPHCKASLCPKAMCAVVLFAQERARWAAPFARDDGPRLGIRRRPI